MGNEVVALEYKADGVVSVRVPVAVFIFFCRNTVDDKISAVVAVKTADHIQQSCFSRTRGAENCDEFVVAKIERYSVKRYLRKLSRLESFLQTFKLKHRCLH